MYADLSFFDGTPLSPPSSSFGGYAHQKDGFPNSLYPCGFTPAASRLLNRLMESPKQCMDNRNWFNRQPCDVGRISYSCCLVMILIGSSSTLNIVYIKDMPSAEGTTRSKFRDSETTVLSLSLRNVWSVIFSDQSGTGISYKIIVSIYYMFTPTYTYGM